MSEDIERVLQALIERNALQNGVTVSYLSSRLGINKRRIQKIVELLERSGYVRVQRLDRVTLVTPTLSGYEKAAALRRETQREKTAPPASALAFAAGALLAAIALGLIIWWLGLFPPADSSHAAESAPLPSATPALSSASVSLRLPTTTEPLPISTVTTTPTETPSPVPPTVPPPSPTVTSTPTPEGPGPLPTAIPIDLAQAGAVPTPVSLMEQPEGTVNIVLMGADTSQGSWRTDTLIVVSIDPNLPSVSMLSIPRDLFVYIPGWKMGRINTADFHGERVGYPGGGAGLVKATIEYNLGIRAHYFARADFQGFVKILETLGGVDVVVDCELRDTFPDPEAPGGASDIELLPGVHHLQGKQALWYARSRWNTSDFDRGRRQQRVLRGAFAQIKQLELLTKLPELWDELTQTVQTDIPLETALWLAKVASRLEATTAIKSRFIDNTVVQAWRTGTGAAVVLPVYERVRPLVAEALAPPDTSRARQGVARVEVLNGTSWDNWAILAADRLLWEGFDVVNIAQSEQTDTQQTTIIDYTKTDKGSQVNFLAAVLRANGAGVKPSDAPSEELDFQVIVGTDYAPCYKSYWRTVHGASPTPAP